MRQVIDSLMQFDVPFMTSLFCFINEPKRALQAKKYNLQKEREFANIFCFVDDLRTINDNFEFAKNFKEIYPPELALKK